MARIIKYDGDDIINIDQKVGAYGLNQKNDVMAVQGLLKYLTQFTKRWCSVPLPEPNGSLDGNTRQAILDYQQMVRSRPQPNYRWVAKDGAISPYKPGVELLYKQAWTIIEMNLDCGMINAAVNDGKGHVDAICKRWPLTVAVALGRANPLFL